VDERTRYFRRLRKLHNSARRWSVLGGGLVAATAVLTPYSGIGIADAIWAGAAGSSVALAWWRWSDHRALAALPPPPAPDPALAGRRLTAAIERFPAGRTMLNEVRRQKSRYALRGSAITQSWDRLDRASATLAALSGRLTGPGEAAVLEAAVAEQWLADSKHPALSSLVDATDRLRGLAEGLAELKRPAAFPDTAGTSM